MAESTMQALNHTAFGTLIAVTIKEPLLVAPLAFSSHFVLDVLPHYGEDTRAPRGSIAYHIRIALDAMLSLFFIILALHLFPNSTGVILLSVFFSLLPDVFWPFALYIKQSNPLWKFLKFHKGIQKFESPRGAYTEVVWFLATITLLIQFR